MNVLSLPDEILASVLKYISFGNLTKVRQVSSRIDLVTRRYGLDKLKIRSMQIAYSNTKVMVTIFDQKGEKKFTQPPADLLNILKYNFSKIRAVKYLYLYNAFGMKIAPISNEVGEFLLGNCCRSIANLAVVDWDISMSFNTMRNILTKLKLKALFISGRFTEFEFSEELIERIPFHRLTLLNKIRAKISMKLSIPFLARHRELKIPSNLFCDMYNSTVTDIGEFFKLWTKDALNTIVRWTLCIPEETMSVEETVQYLSQLECFENYTVTHWNVEHIVVFYIISKRVSATTNKKTRIEIAVCP